MLGVPRQYLSVALMLSYKLDFSCANMTSVPRPSHKLHFSSKLVKLDFSKNSISNIATKELAHTLSSCINLQELDVRK